MWEEVEVDGAGSMLQDGVIPRFRRDDILPEHLQITPLDIAGRRALWIKFGQPFDNGGYVYACDGTYVEMRSGREGDDSVVMLRAGEVLTPEKITEIVGCLLRAGDALGMT
jgi:hypothetical protein